MSAVLASYVKMSTLVDGTMRVVLDIEPTAAPEAFAMLGAPGSPIALARITDAAAVAQDRKAQGAAEKKPLSLASKAALACQSRDFQDFLRLRYAYVWDKTTSDCEQCGDPFKAEDVAVIALRDFLDIRSRAEILEGSPVGKKWLDLEADYHDWQRRRAA